MNAVVQRLSVWLLVLGFALIPTVACAYSYVMMKDADLFDSADGVATARVERVQPAADGDRETRYVLRILDVLAGPHLAAQETLVLPGTFDAPNLNFVVDGVPRIAPGSTVLLFHLRRADGVLQPLQLSLGLFARLETDQGAYYVRHLEGQREFGKRESTRRYLAARAAVSFERWLADRGRGVVRAPDYLREQVVIETDAKHTFSVFTFPVPGPGRWFQFDTAQVLPWTARPDGQANTTFDEFASLQQALAAWTNDANSRIHLNYTGTLASSPTCNQSSDPGCFTGHVLWNDPLGEISGSYNCSIGGILGIGGSLVFSNGQQFAGQTWYPRSLAVVTIQDNAGCSMDDFNGADGAELLTHEIGHTLAFGHACGDGSSPACNTSVDLNEATMRATLHGDGRGAALGIDDRAGAAIAYPQPGGGDLTAPTIPANLVVNANGPGAINTSWSASSDSGGSGLAGYELERCPGAACINFAEIAEQAGTNFADTSVNGTTTYRYRVRAFDGAGNRSGYSSIASATTPALSNGVPVTALAGVQNSERFFTLQVPAGATNLVFQASGGSGDADLYVRFGTAPTTVTFDCRSEGPSNTETCSIPVAQAGTYHVMLRGFAAYSGLSLVGSFQVPVTCAGDCVFRSGFE